MSASLHVIRTDLPTSDIVVVRDESGRISVVADNRLPQVAVDDALRDLDQIMRGPAYALD